MLNLNTLNPQQRMAVLTHKGPVLILAGAGTGKTRVITFRIAHMVANGVPQGAILAVTFTNKAAKEMKERVSQLLPKRKANENGEKPQAPTISTFHALGARILREHIDRLGYKKNFVIYDDSEQVAAIKKILSHMSLRDEKLDPPSILADISRIKSARSEEPTMVRDRPLAALLLPKYTSALKACNAIDFDDLLLLTLKLFEEHPDILEEYRNRFRYVMVDEYQDTNAAQFDLVRMLTCEHRNLCVVGDDDQSIYGWRGAEIANLLDLEKFYPEVKVIKLEQNYRSTNNILNAANALIVKNARRREKRLWSQKGDGEKLVLYSYDNEEAEARALVERIQAASLIHKIPWGKQAVLFRTNQQSRALEMAFRQGNVRYHLIGGQSFFDRREIRDVMAYLKVFLNPHDDISLLRIANVPARGLSDQSMERILTASQQRGCSVYTVMQHTDVQDALPPRARDSLRVFLNWIHQTRDKLLNEPNAPLRPWGEQWITECGYINELRRMEKNAESADNRARNLKDLIASLDGTAPDTSRPRTERLESFLEELSLDREREEEDDPNANMVTLITMHSCKGLEFPHVHIVGVEDGLIPHSRSRLENTVDEERRLFYVALTRAQETLALSHCISRKKYGETIPCAASPFLAELPKELVEDGNKLSNKPVSVTKGKSLFDLMRQAAASAPEQAPAKPPPPR